MKQNKDVALKEAILNDNLDIVFNKARLEAFKGNGEPLEALKNTYGKDVARVTANINNSKRKKYKRCRHRIEQMVLDGNAWFVTLTFNDKTLARTSKDTRRQYVRRNLQKHFEIYVANIDYGTKNEREHYHALIYCQHDPTNEIKAFWDKYGFSKVEQVRTTEDDAKRTIKYVVKLTRHALKETTQKGQSTDRVIYSKEWNSRKIPPEWLFEEDKPIPDF